MIFRPNYRLRDEWCCFSCSDGYLKIYLKGQETTDSYDKFDHEMCGEESNPSVVVSDGPRLVMVFSSGENTGRGFKANYTFETGNLVNLSRKCFTTCGWHLQNIGFPEPPPRTGRARSPTAASAGKGASSIPPGIPPTIPATPTAPIRFWLTTTNRSR